MLGWAQRKWLSKVERSRVKIYLCFPAINSVFFGKMAVYMICVCISIYISNCIFISNVFVFVCCHLPCLANWVSSVVVSCRAASFLPARSGRQAGQGRGATDPILLLTIQQYLTQPRPGIIHHNILQTLVFSQYNNTTHTLFLYKQSCIAIFYKRARWGGVTEHVCPSLGKTPPLPHKSVGQGDFNISASTCITSNSTS